jgi:hypothetical protein
MRFSYFTLQFSTLIAASIFMENPAFAVEPRRDLKALQQQEQLIGDRVQDSSKQASVISRKLGHLIEDLEAFPENSSELKLALQQELGYLSKLATTMDILREELSEEQAELDDLLQADDTDGLKELTELKEKVAKDFDELERTYSHSQGLLSKAAQHLEGKSLDTPQAKTDTVVVENAAIEPQTNEKIVIAEEKPAPSIGEEPAVAKVIAVHLPEEIEPEGRELGGIPRGQINASILKEGTLEKLGHSKLTAELKMDTKAPKALDTDKIADQMDPEPTGNEFIKAENDEVLSPDTEAPQTATADASVIGAPSETAPIATAEQIEKPISAKSSHKKPEIIAQNDVAKPTQNQPKANWKQRRAILAENPTLEQPTPLQPLPLIEEAAVATAEPEKSSFPTIMPPPAKPEAIQASSQYAPLPPVKTALLPSAVNTPPIQAETFTAELPPLEGIDKVDTLQKDETNLAKDLPPLEELQQSALLSPIETSEGHEPTRDTPFYPPTITNALPLADNTQIPSKSLDSIIQADDDGYKNSPLATLAIEHGASAFKWYVFSAVNRGLYKNPDMEFDIVEFSDDTQAQNAQEVKQILESLGVEPARLHVKKASADDKEPRVNIYPAR